MEPLNEFMETHPQLPVFVSRDWHPRGSVHFQGQGGRWPTHCVAGTRGAEFYPTLRVPSAATIISKGTDPADDGGYSAFEGRTAEGASLKSALQDVGIDTLLVAGLATEYCVLATVLSALTEGFRVLVLLDAVRGLDLESGDVRHALDEMKKAGAVLIRTAGQRAEAA